MALTGLSSAGAGRAGGRGADWGANSGRQARTPRAGGGAADAAAELCVGICSAVAAVLAGAGAALAASSTRTIRSEPPAMKRSPSGWSDAPPSSLKSARTPRSKRATVSRLAASRIVACSPAAQTSVGEAMVQAAGKDGQPIEEWNYLDGFYKRYNKVLLDVMGIERERERLSAGARAGAGNGAGAPASAAACVGGE